MTDNERQRILTVVRWLYPLLTLAGLAILVVSYRRYWYIAVIIAIVILLSYLYLLWVVRQAKARRQAAETAASLQPED